MSKNRKIAMGSVLGLAVVAAIIIALTAGNSESTPEQRQPSSLTTSTLAPSTTATTALVASPTTSAVATTVAPPTTMAEPTPIALRAPVRCAANGTPSGSLPGDDPNGNKRWVTVSRLSGACDASSPAFVLKAIDTRLIWRSDATSFAVFVLDTQNGLDGTAGYADGDCFGPCSENQALVTQAGNFTLRVQADDGPWEVLIQEYR